jgi:hypothetical protein
MKNLSIALLFSALAIFSCTKKGKGKVPVAKNLAIAGDYRVDFELSENMDTTTYPRGDWHYWRNKNNALRLESVNGSGTAFTAFGWHNWPDSINQFSHSNFTETNLSPLTYDQNSLNGSVDFYSPLWTLDTVVFQNVHFDTINGQVIGKGTVYANRWYNSSGLAFPNYVEAEYIGWVTLKKQ